MGRVSICALTLLTLGSGCHPPGVDKVTLARVEELRSIESLLPLAPDSIVQLYRIFTPEVFYAEFMPRIEATRVFIDSLNGGLEANWRIDTLSVDHTLENFGTAARSGQTLYLSSSYFFCFRDQSVIRAAVMHEFGHIHYEMLDSTRKTMARVLWTDIRLGALTYLFRDGEYSGNARFGGHPEDSPEELFASAFNLFTNRPDELEARFRFVDRAHLPLLRELGRLVRESLSPGRGS
jgi:hypothetical protein